VKGVGNGLGATRALSADAMRNYATDIHTNEAPAHQCL